MMSDSVQLRILPVLSSGLKPEHVTKAYTFLAYIHYKTIK
jgi:hypothetical protein